MNYEPVFKLPYSNIFITDLFLVSYSEFEPIVTIKNGKWEFFLEDEFLEKMSEHGFQLSLKYNSYNNFQNKLSFLIDKSINF